MTDYNIVAYNLDATADAIEKTGWWNGNDRNNEPGICAGLAIPLGETSEFFCEFLGLEDTDIGSVYKWNDAQKSGDAVVAALRAAAEKARQS